MILIFIAVLIDWAIGDPYSMPHLIRLMGNIIYFEENLARKIARNSKELEIAGLIIVIINILLGILPAFLISKIFTGIIYKVFCIIIYYYCISARMLHYEAMEVKKALEISVEAGRERVKYIVGRDTGNLSEKEIIRATVETVAENTSDGVIAPLFYIVLFGPIGGITYKFINTMDSMIAYKNEKYLHIGRGAAIVDDIVNYIPARLTGILMALSTFSVSRILKTFKDIKEFGRNHSSPNAGYPESAVASILGIQLGGGQYYYGEYVEKPTIGYKTKELDIKDIFKTVKIMYKSELLLLFFIFIGSLIFKF